MLKDVLPMLIRLLDFYVYGCPDYAVFLGFDFTHALTKKGRKSGLSFHGIR